jgi:hypothetical protein
MQAREELRAADADREAVAGRLQQAVDEGRLDLQEYDERLVRAYAAKTYGELDRLLTDLPGPSPLAGPIASPAGPKRDPGDATRAWLAARWRPWARVVAICLAIWAVSALASGPGYFWPVWVAGPWGAVLLVSTLAGLASREPQRWASRRASRRLAGWPAEATGAGTTPDAGTGYRHPGRRRHCH